MIFIFGHGVNRINNNLMGIIQEYTSPEDGSRI